MLSLLHYSNDKKSQWDSFVCKAKNNHFFFLRDYMEYHADRFEDHSLMVYDEKDKLIALFPANLEGDVLYSHQGLTFGGLLIDVKMRTETVIDIFSALKSYCKKKNIYKLVYKCIPYIYHTSPAEEDRYALFVHGAELVRRDVSSTIYLEAPVRYSKGRKWTVNKSKKENLLLSNSYDFGSYWKLLENTMMMKYGEKPVHSCDEIQLLAKKFPENIKLFTVNNNADQLLAGALIYENSLVVHTQYLTNSEQGREVGALDLLLDHLIKNIYNNKKYFDFGISNENNGSYLNKGLIAQKEGFGARAVVHDFYEIEIK